MLSPTERTLRARIGAHALHATHDPRQTTAAARAASRSALDRRLLDLIDPDGTLAPAERARRLEHARGAHFGQLALKRAKAQRAKRGKAVRGA